VGLALFSPVRPGALEYFSLLFWIKTSKNSEKLSKTFQAPVLIDLAEILSESLFRIRFKTFSGFRIYLSKRN
jgi:hypothetical protein